ncbi:MAG: hypothetical protein Q7S55_04310 [Nanoarchaeota archaeon]|nr:hypothetical protein [Nanoarchaeota archaeon]
MILIKKRLLVLIIFYFLLIGCTPTESPTDPLVAEDDLRFIIANPLDLSQIQRMSLFRSCIGHDYSGLNIDGEKETLRSMKHYLEPLPSLIGTDQIKIFAPFDGKVVEILDGPPGKAIYISAKVAPSWKFIFFHVVPAIGIEEGILVQAGEQLGTVSGDINSNFDFALKQFSWNGQVFDSPFMHMSNSILEEYAANGVTPENIIFSKEARDAEPCPVEGTKNGDALFTGYKDQDFVAFYGR